MIKHRAEIQVICAALLDKQNFWLSYVEPKAATPQKWIYGGSLPYWLRQLRYWGASTGALPLLGR